MNAEQFIKEGEVFQDQLEVGKRTSQRSIKECCEFLRDYYYNKNNHTNLKSVLTMLEMVNALKTYDNTRGKDE